MAIVRTTKETGTTGTAPPAPADNTKSVVAKTSRVPARTAMRRPAAAPGAPVQGSRSPRDFISDTIAELRRVVWPTHREVEAGTIVTIGLLIFFAAYIYGLDMIVRELFIAIGVLPKVVGQ